MLRVDPTVDVVICTNRESPYLAAAVESVLAQSWRKWQLVIVDDGAPAPVAEGLDRLVATTQNARVIHQSPSGLPAARNAGARASRGELVAFLDDDDVWHPDRLAIQVAAMRGIPDSVGAFSGGWYMGADGGSWGEGWSVASTPSVDFLDGTVPLPRIVTLLVKREAWARIGGFNEAYTLGEDLDFMLRLAQVGELTAVPEALVGYRRHESNMTNAPVVDAHRAVEALLRNLIADAKRDHGELAASALRQNLRSYRKNSGPATVNGLIEAIRDHKLSRVAGLAWWAATRAPAATAQAGFRRVRTQVHARAKGIWNDDNAD